MAAKVHGLGLEPLVSTVTYNVRPSASKKAPGLADVAATVGMWGRKFNLVVSSCKPVRWFTSSYLEHYKIGIRNGGCSSIDYDLLLNSKCGLRFSRCWSYEEPVAYQCCHLLQPKLSFVQELQGKH